MKFLTTDPSAEPSRILYKRCAIDLKTGSQLIEEVPCRNLEDVLGGFGRSFQNLAERLPWSVYARQGQPFR